MKDLPSLLRSCDPHAAVTGVVRREPMCRNPWSPRLAAAPGIAPHRWSEDPTLPGKLQHSGYCGVRINRRPRGKGDYEGSPVPPALLLIHTPHSPGCYDGNLCAAILGVHDWPQLPESHHTDGFKIRRPMEAATHGLLRRTDQQETKRKGRLLRISRPSCAPVIHTLQSPVWYDGNPCAAILGATFLKRPRRCGTTRCRSSGSIGRRGWRPTTPPA